MAKTTPYFSKKLKLMISKQLADFMRFEGDFKIVWDSPMNNYCEIMYLNSHQFLFRMAIDKDNINRDEAFGIKSKPSEWHLSDADYIMYNLVEVIENYHIFELDRVTTKHYKIEADIEITTVYRANIDVYELNEEKARARVIKEYQKMIDNNEIYSQHAEIRSTIVNADSKLPYSNSYYDKIILSEKESD